MPPEGDDGHLSFQSVLLLGVVDAEQLTETPSCEPDVHFTKNTVERRWKELHLDQIKEMLLL